jgi:cytochrome c peroxidase
MKHLFFLLPLAAVLARAEEKTAPPTSYMPVASNETFDDLMKRTSGEKAGVTERQRALLEDRYDLSDLPSDAKMSRGKAVQGGVRVKPPAGYTFEKLGELSPEEIRGKDLFPKGFLPLPHVKQAEGGMVFPDFHIKEVNRQQGDHDLTRFDVDFDLPDRFLPEFPPPIYLTTRPDLGDVSKGRLITLENYYETFNGILNPKQLEGLRLLLTPFPQQ